MTRTQMMEAYEGGQSIESLGGMQAAITLWMIYGGDEAASSDDPPVAIVDIGEWIACNEEVR